MSLIIKCFPKGPLAENTYLVQDEATGLKAVVDPGYFGEEITSCINDPGELEYILLTHGHHDHFAAAGRYIEAYPDAKFCVPAAESYLLKNSMDNRMMALGSDDWVCPDADIFLREGDTLLLGETTIRVIETPGHTEGGICYVTKDEVFSGDTLFRLSVGNTSFETGDFGTLASSIESKLYTLPEKTTVYPGHGSSTTIGYEKRANPFV